MKIPGVPPVSEDQPTSVGMQNVVYITVSNSKQLVANAKLDGDFQRDELINSFPHFNRLEYQQLLAYKQLCQFPQQYLESAATRVRKEKGDLLFGDKPPAFHRSPKCRFALSDYVNYEVPEEIKKMGREKEFREWWAQQLEKHPAYRDNPLLMDKLLSDCQMKFKLLSKPRQVKDRNSGITTVTKEQIHVLEATIAQVVADAASFVNSSRDHRTILGLNGTHAYKGASDKHPVNNFTALSDQEVRKILSQYENDYKKVLIALLQTYYRSKYNNELVFDHSLLMAAGFYPCYGCFNTDTRRLPQGAPLPINGGFSLNHGDLKYGRVTILEIRLPKVHNPSAVPGSIVVWGQDYESSNVMETAGKRPETLFTVPGKGLRKFLEFWSVDELSSANAGTGLCVGNAFDKLCVSILSSNKPFYKGQPPLPRTGLHHSTIVEVADDNQPKDRYVDEIPT